MNCRKFECRTTFHSKLIFQFIGTERKVRTKKESDWNGEQERPKWMERAIETKEINFAVEYMHELI